MITCGPQVVSGAPIFGGGGVPSSRTIAGLPLSSDIATSDLNASLALKAIEAGDTCTITEGLTPAVEAAVDAGTSHISVIDADGTYRPKDLVRLIDALGDRDLPRLFEPFRKLAGGKAGR